MKGFTLIEVLIAMAITALVATLSFSSLSSTLNSVEGLRSQGERISELNRAWMLLSRDLNQFVSRPIRNEFGAIEASMYGGESAENSLVFTRTGWHNPGPLTRSHLQRVRYVLEDDTLWRESFRVLDRTTETEPQRVALFSNVSRFEMAFLAGSTEVTQGEFDSDDWPSAWGVGASGDDVSPPQAVELRLELLDWGELRWLYEIPYL